MGRLYEPGLQQQYTLMNKRLLSKFRMHYAREYRHLESSRRLLAEVGVWSQRPSSPGVLGMLFVKHAPISGLAAASSVQHHARKAQGARQSQRRQVALVPVSTAIAFVR